MKNRTLAIFGISSYLLSVVTSATDLEGNYILPVALSAIIDIAKIVFITMAVARFWKGGARFEAAFIIAATVIHFALSIVHGIGEFSDNTGIILCWNISKVIFFIAFLWAFNLLWVSGKGER